MDNFLTQLSSISIIDWFAMLTGIVGVYLSIKEKILAWPLFILCYATYVYISLRGNYYAFGGMNVIFALVAAYGWFGWSKSSKKRGGEIHISHLAPALRWIVAAFICVGTLGLGYLLELTGEARFPYYDAFAATCSLSAQWMLSRKYIENWIFWILADIVYLSFFIKDGIWPSVVLFTVFIFLAIKGWIEWKTIIKKTA